MKKTYSHLKQFDTFLERFNYLKIGGVVGKSTFGSNRYLYQQFLHSDEWKNFRNEIIIRDDGCDLGMRDRDIQGKLLVHHIEPILQRDILEHNVDKLLNPDNVICVSFNTHEAIHYGDESLLINDPIIRTPGDTILWRR